MRLLANALGAVKVSGREVLNAVDDLALGAIIHRNCERHQFLPSSLRTGCQAKMFHLMIFRYGPDEE